MSDRARGATLLHRAWGNANEARTKLRYAWHEFFKRFDVLLTPVAATAAFRSQISRKIVRGGSDGYPANRPGAMTVADVAAAAGATRSRSGSPTWSARPRCSPAAMRS